MRDFPGPIVNVHTLEEKTRAHDAGTWPMWANKLRERWPLRDLAERVGLVRWAQHKKVRVWVSKIGKIVAKFANFWRARSRLYQNEILQENLRSTAFFKLYKICILLHRCNPKISAKMSV